MVGAGEEPPQAPSAANTSTQTIGMLTSDVALVSDPSFKVAYYLVLLTGWQATTLSIGSGGGVCRGQSQL